MRNEDIAYNHSDSGCSIGEEHYLCLDCPFATCKFDKGAGVYHLKKLKRDAEIKARIRAGAKPREVATEFNLTAHTVRRVSK